MKDTCYCEGYREKDDKRSKIITANGKVEFAITCSHDEGRNATCVSKEKSFRVPVSYRLVGGSGRWVINEEME